VSRTTVVSAYDLLREDDWAESRPGSGTWVQPVSGSRSSRRQDILARSLSRNPVFETLLTGPNSMIDFSRANSGNPEGLDPELFAIQGDDLAQLLGQPGYAPMGLMALRRAIADRYTCTGVPTTPDQILVTTGAQQAISLLATLYVQRGDNVIIDNPTYVGALDAFRAAGARLIPVPVERDGVRVDILRGLLAAARPQIVYLMPSFQNPTGAVLGHEQRREVARMAAESGTAVIEDNTLADLALDGEAPPPLAAHAPSDAPVITIGSLSKLFWAGLRVGWVRAPESIVVRLARLKVVADLGSSVLPQVIAARLIPQTDHVKELRRRELLPRLDLFGGLLGELLPTWSWTRPTGGTFLWVRLPYGHAGEFAQLALRYGVIVTPGTTMSVDESHTDYFRLPFFQHPDNLREGANRLARAWDAYAPFADAGSRAVSVIV
jgi:DNA-binding transcriptional MocR family regulator